MRLRFAQWVCVRVAAGCALLLLASSAWAQPNNTCEEGEFPDVIVGQIQGSIRHGALNGITAYSVGTTSCNAGKCWLKWNQTTNEHPVIGQSLFRLRNGRFEQIGQSWLKHGYFALQENACYSDCLDSGTGTRLGVHCSDPYGAGLNGEQARLGPKFEVNPYNGAYPFPATAFGQSGDVIYKRLQAANNDLNPALNSGALYFVEAQYVTADDALGDNQMNNASYRAATISGTINFNLTLTGPTVQRFPAIKAWKAADPNVIETVAAAPGDGEFHVSARATTTGPTWHYEYAVHNLNSQRGASSFTVPLPTGAVVSNVGFHDVDYHSGELVEGTDWTWEQIASPPGIRWTTQSFEENPNANSLRWGTLYNFRFDVNVAPNPNESISLGLWRPGSPSSLSITTVTPRVCDFDFVCEPGENCLRCASDCGAAVGGECCGNGVCQLDESGCGGCTADCGSPTPNETACTNSLDDDCDGDSDCADLDCCAGGACAAFDADGDQHAVACDCDDGNTDVWATPSEAGPLVVTRGPGGEAQLDWSAPASPGGSVWTYDTIRSTDSSNFGKTSICLASKDPTQPTNIDFEDPPADQLFYYAVRARNACPSGAGSLGNGSNGQPRTGPVCP